jgi:hypothetical protein
MKQNLCFVASPTSEKPKYTENILGCAAEQGDCPDASGERQRGIFVSSEAAHTTCSK